MAGRSRFHSDNRDHRPKGEWPTQGSAVSLLDHVSQLQMELARQRSARQERAALLHRLDRSSRTLRNELLEGQCLLEGAEFFRTGVKQRHDDVKHQLVESRERRLALSSRKAVLGAEIHRHKVAAWDEERDCTEEQREREWAREGPETDALRDAKIVLAEALSSLDEVRLEHQREVAALQFKTAAAHAENARLQEALASSGGSPVWWDPLQRLWDPLQRLRGSAAQKCEQQVVAACVEDVKLKEKSRCINEPGINSPLWRRLTG